jgi:hypothetical protein
VKLLEGIDVFCGAKLEGVDLEKCFYRFRHRENISQLSAFAATLIHIPPHLGTSLYSAPTWGASGCSKGLFESQLWRA